MRNILLISILLCGASAVAQKKVRIDSADNLYGSVRNGEQFQRLVGHVKLVQNTTIIHCDSAYFYKTKNRVEAFGHIHITEGDSVDCTSLALSYDGDKKIAHLRKHVIFKKLNIATLYTDFLDYDRIKNEARYF